MGAQILNAVTEISFTDTEDSILVTLATGRTIELFGDGFVQEISVNDREEMKLLEAQL